MTSSSSDLDRLVAAVRASTNYGAICTNAIRNIGSRELAKRRTLKDAIKETKNKLHQVSGAYLERQAQYDQWMRELQEARDSGQHDRLQAACRHIMECHASTRERLPILEQFYETTLSACRPISSVLDLACGLNPLAIPWMSLAPHATYHACDIYSNMMIFLGQCLPLLGVRGTAEALDVLQTPPDEQVDVAFLLKAIPCLEQVDRLASLPLLDTINARHVLVSFPVHSLTGKNKGMLTNYEAHFHNLAALRNWRIQRFAFATELAFLVEKS